MKTVASLLIIALVCVLSSCLSDPTTQEPEEGPWEFVETTPPSERPTPPQPTSYTFETCRDDFVTGPVWRMVFDKQAAMQESQWIAMLGTTKAREFQESQDVDYSLQVTEIKSVFERLDIDIVENQYDEGDFVFVVRGTPKAIESALRESCLLVGFDLTGFHCDCAPEQCQQATTCELRHLPPTTRHPSIRENMRQFTESTGADGYSWPVSCDDDFYEGDIQSYAFTSILGFRGGRWNTSYGAKIFSWNNSHCAVPTHSMDFLDENP